MYEGSMRGAGSAFFAVWGYVISHMMPCRGVNKGTRVELNAEVVAFLIGEKPEVVQAQIDRMCSPDPRSRTKVEGGRRLIRKGEFEFVVVNGDKYRAIRDEDSRREQNRDAQRRHREKILAKGGLIVPAGESLSAAIEKRVREDPITVADKAAVFGPQEPKPVAPDESAMSEAQRAMLGGE
jgi:hypothetical protein